jgi:hypothetical protein
MNTACAGEASGRRRRTLFRGPGWGALPLLVWLACSQATPPGQEPHGAEGAAGPVLTVRESAQGVEVLDGPAPVLFYQRSQKDLDGQYARSNYVHPLMSLDGDVLTEDFPEDHPHHRGIFWAWHQLWAGEERLGDGWALEDFVTDVARVETSTTAGQARIETRVLWRSPRFREGAPFIEERTTIVAHPVVEDARAVDFEIALRARASGIRIGGSEDEKGYGGFSARVQMPEGVVFTGPEGPVRPRNLQVEAGPWIDVSGPYGEGREVSGLTLLCHPDNPGFPQPWILRQTGSMQNAVFPGRDAVGVPTEAPLVLRYRLVVHRGNARRADIERWQAAYADAEGS